MIRVNNVEVPEGVDFPAALGTSQFFAIAQIVPSRAIALHMENQFSGFFAYKTSDGRDAVVDTDRVWDWDHYSDAEDARDRCNAATIQHDGKADFIITRLEMYHDNGRTLKGK